MQRGSGHKRGHLRRGGTNKFSCTKHSVAPLQRQQVSLSVLKHGKKAVAGSNLFLAPDYQAAGSLYPCQHCFHVAIGVEVNQGTGFPRLSEVVLHQCSTKAFAVFGGETGVYHAVDGKIHQLELENRLVKCPGPDHVVNGYFEPVDDFNRHTATG